MLTFSNYKITEILYESANSLVYRGQRQPDGQAVVVKTLREPAPSPQKIAWFKREYELVRNLTVPGVVTAHGLEYDRQRWLMILEDWGGESLVRLKLAGQIELKDFLRLALNIVDILGRLHQQQIMHKDVNPANIILNPTTGQVKLIDFGIATLLSRETPTFRHPNILEGTLAYLSPEQTGRMNRALDYRTDFYSLGATFYELLTGQLPFTSDDALELIHAHIAKQPPPPYKLRPHIPPPVSDIIMKLMAKNAEARYQSAYGLKADLERCLAELDLLPTLEFEPGHQDISDRFQIPQQLYGRDREIETLLAAFARVVGSDSRGGEGQAAEQGPAEAQARSELLLVSGYAGIGKSALVQELYKPLTAHRGFFIAGKFDQLQRNVPYSAFIRAFQALIQQLLTGSEADVAAWREKLLAALGPNGQIMIDVIPELELIIDPQPAPLELGPAENQNRFNLVFQNFINVFCRADHPLVIFLDDLQWSDSASLKLLELLMTTPDSRYLFIIGAYRANEVSAAHPLMLTLATIQEEQAPISEITLPPLGLSHVTRLIADTLHTTPAQVTALAEMVQHKTEGNPFFLNEFLKSLYTDGLITFDPQQGRWQWDLAQIRAKDITANVVELMMGKVKKLPPDAQTILQLAACIGNQFDLKTLAIVYAQPLSKTAADLWAGVTEGLLLPVSDTYKLVEVIEAQTPPAGLNGHVPPADDGQVATVEYKFAHDRVQQAAYALIADLDKATIHYKVGQLLRQAMEGEPAEREAKLFDTVNQLNQGRSLITEQAERVEVAKLNLQAGRKAKAEAAYEPAFNYLQTGIDLLTLNRPNPATTWQHNYDLALALHTEATEAAYLSGDLAAMEQFGQIVLERAKTTLDKSKIYETQILAYTAHEKALEAVDVALQALEALGLTYPKNPNMLHVVWGLLRTKLAARGQQTEALVDLPVMTDPVKLATMRILNLTTSPTFIAKPNLLPLITFDMVKLSLTYGNAPASTIAYGTYGLILGGPIGDQKGGYQFGQLSLNLLAQLNVREFRPKTEALFNLFIKHWQHPLQDTLRPLLETYQSGLESGDFESAAVALQGYSFHAYLSGRALADLAEEMDSYGQAIGQLKQETMRRFTAEHCQAVLNLLGASDTAQEREDGSKPQPYHLIGDAYNAGEMLPLQEQANDRTGICVLYIHQLILSYLFQAHPQAVENGTAGEPYLDGVIGSAWIPFFYFYDSLARLAHYPEVAAAQQRQYRRKVAANQKKLKKWAVSAPMNYQHKYDLVEAERARIEGDIVRAGDLYEVAIRRAREQSYLQEEALAYELAARFYLARNMAEIGQTYMTKAHYGYRLWQARAKVADLEKRYPEFFVQPPAGSKTTSTSPSITTTTGGRTGTSLDLASVLKASQAISGEIVLHTLLAKLMRIIIENAGAERGFLIMVQDGEWRIEAESRVDQPEVTALQSLPLTAPANDGSRRPRLPLSIINYITRTHENVVLNDATGEGPFRHDPYIVANEPKSVLCVPLLNQGQLTGILYLENNLIAGAFTPDRVELLNLLSSQAAISIENASLYTNLERSEKKYRTLFEDSHDAIYITNPAGQVIDMNPAGLALFGYSRTEIQQVEMEDVYVDPTDHHRFREIIERRGAVRDFEVKYRKKDGTEMDCLETATLRRAEDGTIISYEGIVRDVTAQKRAEQERLQLTAIQQELTIAQGIQTDLLPAARPDWPDLDLICYSLPARSVGGDLYAYHAFDPAGDQEKRKKFAVMVGDVSGKGMPAALLMAVSLASFQSGIDRRFAPADLLIHLSQTIRTYVENSHQNCAMVYAEIDRPGDDDRDEKTTIRAVNAGCIPPIIRRTDGSVEWMEVGGLPLGIDLSLTLGYQAQERRLSPGDLLILTSDGVVEATTATDELFGFDRLEAAVADGPITSAQAMLEHLKSEVRRFVQNAEHHDDITIVVVKV